MLTEINAWILVPIAVLIVAAWAIYNILQRHVLQPKKYLAETARLKAEAEQAEAANKLAKDKFDSYLASVLESYNRTHPKEFIDEDTLIFALNAIVRHYQDHWNVDYAERVVNGDPTLRELYKNWADASARFSSARWDKDDWRYTWRRVNWDADDVPKYWEAVRGICLTLVIGLAALVVVSLVTGFFANSPNDDQLISKSAAAKQSFGFVSGREYPFVIGARAGGSVGSVAGDLFGFSGSESPASSFPFSYHSAKTGRDYVADLPIGRVRFETVANAKDESVKLTTKSETSSDYTVWNSGDEWLSMSCAYRPLKKRVLVNFIAVKSREKVCHYVPTGALGDEQFGAFLSRTANFADAKITEADYQKLLGKI